MWASPQAWKSSETEWKWVRDHPKQRLQSYNLNSEVTGHRFRHMLLKINTQGYEHQETWPLKAGYHTMNMWHSLLWVIGQGRWIGADNLLHTVLFQDPTSSHLEAPPYALGILSLIIFIFPGGQEWGKSTSMRVAQQILVARLECCAHYFGTHSCDQKSPNYRGTRKCVLDVTLD